MFKIFIIGSTGHIGGAIFEQLVHGFENIEIVALVRKDEAAEKIRERYGETMNSSRIEYKHIIGNLDSCDILEAAAWAAEIVIYAGPDIGHEAGIAAILRGLSRRPTKSYYIHTSGAASIWEKPDGSKPGNKVWDDIADIDKIKALPASAAHSVTDKFVLESAATVNVAIISPVMLYGLSPSIEHPTPLTLPEIIKTCRGAGTCFTISKGANIQGFVHCDDLAKLYLLLVSDAFNNMKNNVDPQLQKPGRWDSTAYYFGSGEDHSFRDYMNNLAPVLVKHGVIKDEVIQPIAVERAAQLVSQGIESYAPDSWSMYIAMSYGVDMAVRSSRAKQLGWKPRESGFAKSLDEVIRVYLERKNTQK